MDRRSIGFLCASAAAVAIMFIAVVSVVPSVFAGSNTGIGGPCAYAPLHLLQDRLGGVVLRRVDGALPGDRLSVVYRFVDLGEGLYVPCEIGRGVGVCSDDDAVHAAIRWLYAHPEVNAVEYPAIIRH